MSEFVRGIREILEEKIESKRKELESVRNKHLMQHECTLSTELDQKNTELELHTKKWFQGKIIKKKNKKIYTLFYYIRNASVVKNVILFALFQVSAKSTYYIFLLPALK